MRYPSTIVAATMLGLLATLPPPTCGADPTSTATYAAVLGLAVFAVKHEGSMNDALVRMATSTAAATGLRAEISRDENEADTLQREASADEGEAKDLLAEAEQLVKQEAEDEEGASQDEEKAKELEEHAKDEEAEAEKLQSEAGEDEAIFQSLRRNATALSRLADEDRFEADSIPDVGICRFWIFRSLCDGLGAAARVRSEAAERAAEEAEAAAEEFNRAKVIKDREEEERKEADELETKAKEDRDEAVGLEQKAEKEKERAEEEEREAEEEKVHAETAEEKSKTEADKAKALKAKASDETKRANAFLEESMKHGQSAYTNGVLAAVFAGIVFAFFSVRLFVRYILQVAWGIVDCGVCLMRERQAPHPSPNIAGRACTSLPKHKICRFLVHCTGFIAILAAFSNKWMEVESYSVRNRGWLVLLCACLAGAVQSLVLCAIPRLYLLIRSTDIACELLIEGDAVGGIVWETTASFTAGFIFVTFLSAIEILLLWVNLGPEKFGSFTHSFNVPLMWLLFILGSWVNFRLFGGNDDLALSQDAPDLQVLEKDTDENKSNCYASERDALIKSDRNISIGEFEIVVDYAESSSDGEMDTLLSHGSHSSTNKSNATAHKNASIEHEGIRADASMEAEETASLTMDKYVDGLQLPFELLVISCMAAILRACVPKCRQLLPVIRSLGIMSAKHASLHMLVISTVVVVLGLSLWYVILQNKRNRQRSQQPDPALYQNV